MDRGPCAPAQALTIYTDASFSLGTGSWGAVVKGLETELHLSGAFAGTCHSSEQAELQAIAIVLHNLARDGHLHRGASVRIYTDNRACDMALNRQGKFKRNREAMQQAMDTLQRVIEAGQLQVKCCWIKGHQPLGNTVHGDANRIADALARAAHPTIPSVTQKRREHKRRRRERDRLARARETDADKITANVARINAEAQQVQA